MHGNIVHIGCSNGGHLTTLNFGHAIVRVQNKDIDIFTATTAFNRRRTGVTRGGTHNHHFLIALGENIVEQIA